MKRIYTFILSLALLLSTSCATASDVSAVVTELAPTTVMSTTTSTSSRFSDVADTHWALEYIEGLADGGLLSGYTDGTFNPDGELTVAQLATIIAKANGIDTTSSNDYWAYKAVYYCIYIARCMTDLGTIVPANYDVACTRELAVYMIVEGLGANENTTVDTSITADDIPDWRYIISDYQDAVLTGFRWNLVTGVNDLGEFAPRQTLTRAEVATLLYRAGYTTAAEIPEVEESDELVGQSSADVFAELSTWDEFTLSYHSYSYGITTAILTSDAQYGGIRVEFSNFGVISFTMEERNPNQSTTWFDSNGNMINMYGEIISQETSMAWYQANGVSGDLNADGVMQMSSGYTYEARMLILKMFKVIFPYSYEEAYDAYFSTLKQETYEVPSTGYPSALRWIDGRTLAVTLSQGLLTDRKMTMRVGEVNAIEYYELWLSEEQTDTQRTYNSYYNHPMSIVYEFDRG